MFIRILCGMAMAVVSTIAFAAGQTDASCQGAACFSQFNSVMTNNQTLQKATKLAWRPGHYKSNGRSRSYSSSGSSSSSGFRSWFTSVPRTGPANSKGTIVFSPRNSTFAAYDSNGDLVKSGRASGGMSWCDDVERSCRTPVGTFRVYNKGPEDCVSNKYPLGEGGAPMPHCMYFNGGYALHGSYYVPSHPASHGCIRVTPSKAAWPYKNFVRIGTVIKVQSY